MEPTGIVLVIGAVMVGVMVIAEQSSTLTVRSGDFQVKPPVKVVCTLKVTVTCVVMLESISMTVSEPDWRTTAVELAVASMNLSVRAFDTKLQ